MEDDDAPRGHLLTRREAIALLGAGGVWLLTGCTREEAAQHAEKAAASNTALPAGCVVRPEQTEGPYFVDEDLNRSDLRSDPGTGEVKPGVPLALAFQVSRLQGDACAALAGAIVDVWHCDALGLYSDVRDRNDTRGQKFLRGHQRTDAQGVARFTTIYPGWYQGRTVHVHFKIRTDPASRAGQEFTSQLYFDDDLTDRVHAREPYATKGARDLRNDRDGIFQDGGSQLLLAPHPSGEGYAATFDVALQGA